MNKTVLVTGSSTGIGEACVARLAKGGARVYAGVRKPEDGERLTNDHEGNIIPVILDVTDQASIDTVIAQIDDECGQLDGLVNNAGIAVSGPVEMLEVSEWRDQFEVNLFGLVAMTKAAFPLIVAAGGRFVHIGSNNGRVSGPGVGPYAASKHALEALNWSIRAEMAHVGPVKSSLIEPGAIKTPIWDKGEEQFTEQVARYKRDGLDGRYGWLIDMFRGFLDEAHEKAIDPDKVAEAVEHALTADRPKARYLVGTDAKIQARIVMLPDRLSEFILAKGAAQYIKAGRSRSE